MSKATKRKHVTKEVLEDYILPEGDQQIMRVLASRGNNLHEVETPKGQKFLASMPTKFRKNVWIKRGDFVITIPIEEGDKVKAEIYTILYPDQIKYIKQEGLWPEEFDKGQKKEQQEMIPSDMLPPSDDDSDTENDPDLVVNANRPNIQYYESSEDSSEEEEDEEEGGIDNNKTVKDVNNTNGN